MIKRINDLSDIRGSQPLMSVIQTDFCFSASDNDGVYVQVIDDANTLVLSLRGVTATICSLSHNADIEELISFLSFHHVSNVLSDFFFEGINLQKRAVLKAIPQNDFCGNINELALDSRLADYKNVFNLLSKNGSFDVWFSAFSRKVNNAYASGVYIVENSTAISCALAPFICDGVGVVAGVRTDGIYRKKGYATQCVKALLAELKRKGVNTAYLWCEDKNIKFYESIGFSVCGEIFVKKEE